MGSGLYNSPVPVGIYEGYGGWPYVLLGTGE